MRSNTQTSCLRKFSLARILGIASLACWLGMTFSAFGQLGGLRAAQKPAAPAADEGSSVDMVGSPLEIDRGLKKSLTLAEQSLAKGDTLYALQIWQEAMSRAKNTLTTKEEWNAKLDGRDYVMYRSISTEIERRLASLAPADLRLYRSTYDSEAELLLKIKSKIDRLTALEEVVDQYFISSLGDESAFYLAQIWFDRGDYARAARMLQKIQTTYPNSNISAKQIQLRLALASVRMRDFRTAQEYWKAYENLFDGLPPENVRRLYAREMTQAAAPLLAQGNQTGAWPMPFGGASRNFDMPNLPTDALDEELSEHWKLPFTSQIEQAANTNANNRRTVVFAGGRSTYTTNAVNTKSLVEEWRNNGWMPARSLYFDQGRMYINGNDRVMCFRAEDGKELWRGRVYQFEAEPSVRYYPVTGTSNSSRQPQTIPEIRLFGDRLHPQLTIHENTLYALEGQLLDWDTKPQLNQVKNVTINLGARRSRTNWLAAYNSINGDFKWRRNLNDPNNDETGDSDFAFLAAPVPFGDHLLIPAALRGELWLYSLDKNTGKTNWKVFLWDEPLEGVSPWSAIGTALEGGDLYLSSGMGFAFALDAATGKVHWAVKYARNGFRPANMRGFNPSMMANLQDNGWLEDVVIPHGNQVVILPSDYKRMVALDRRTGAFLWDAKQAPSDVFRVNYCLGVSGDGLYVGSKEIIRRYSISNGYLTWETPVTDSFGQAALTPEGIYVPTNDSILKLDSTTGKILSQTHVTTPTGEPVGNLFSDGNNLYGVGAQRVYALATLSQRMKALAQQIAKGDGQAQLLRMQIHRQRGNRKAAILDLEAGFEKIRQAEGFLPACVALHEGIEELELTEREPGIALQLLIDAYRPAIAAKEPVMAGLSKEARQELESVRGTLIYTAFDTIQSEPDGASLERVLTATAFCTTPYLESYAIRTVTTLANPQDRRRLEAALKNGTPPTKMAAAEALLKLVPEETSTIAESLLADSLDRLRLQGAKILAEDGDRKVLPILVGLLESEDLNVRVHGASILRALTRENFPFTAYEEPEVRAKDIAQWKAWVKDKGETVVLTHPLLYGGDKLGRTLYTDYNSNTIYELDEKGNQVWRQTGVNRPWACQGLPNGNRLVSSYLSRSVHEFDKNGKEVWTVKSLPGNPFSVQRLRNGNTLVSCSNHRIYEYTPQGNVVNEILLQGIPRSAQRLDNGNTLVSLNSRNEVIEVNPAGKIIWQVPGMNSPIAAQRLANGNTMIAQYNSRAIIEVNPEGKEVFRKTWNLSLYDVKQLENGHILIVDSNGYKEIDRGGKIVSQKIQPGIRGISRY